MIDPALQHTAAWLLSLVFAVAAIGKITAWEELAGVVHNYKLLPAVLVPLVSALLPPLELSVAVGLLVPGLRSLAAGAAIVLLCVFALAIGINVRRGRTSIDCGCFRSALKQPISWWLVLRNLILCVFALACMTAPTARELLGPDYVTIAFGSVTLFLVYLGAGYATLAAPPRFDDQVAMRTGANA